MICCSTYLCIHWLFLVCVLTRDRTRNLGLAGWHSTQLSYPARATIRLFKNSLQFSCLFVLIEIPLYFFFCPHRIFFKSLLHTLLLDSSMYLYYLGIIKWEEIGSKAVRTTFKVDLLTAQISSSKAPGSCLANSVSCKGSFVKQTLTVCTLSARHSALRYWPFGGE